MLPLTLFGPLVGALSEYLDRKLMLAISTALVAILQVVMVGVGTYGRTDLWHDRNRLVSERPVLGN